MARSATRWFRVDYSKCVGILEPQHTLCRLQMERGFKEPFLPPSLPRTEVDPSRTFVHLWHENKIEPANPEGKVTMLYTEWVKLLVERAEKAGYL
jgi:hypothetical protein